MLEQFVRFLPRRERTENPKGENFFRFHISRQKLNSVQKPGLPSTNTPFPSQSPDKHRCLKFVIIISEQKEFWKSEKFLRCGKVKQKQENFMIHSVACAIRVSC
jgi:hypothetical protein